MTGRTTHAFVHMNAVIEVSVVWQVVHPDPLNRFAGAEAGTNRLEIRAIRPNLLMAVHAGLCGWKAGRRSGFNRGVTIAAIQSIVSDVVLMTKLDWLLALDPLPRVPGRTVQLRSHPKRGEQNKNRAVDRSLRECVRAVMKNLWHRRSFANPS